MIILKLLSVDNFYGISEEIEIAKGKYKLPLTFKEGFKQIKRNYYEKRSN
jgi:hypothetical protein